MGEKRGGLLVLGASGFLGVHLVEAALDLGQCVHAVSRRGPGGADSPRLVWHRADLVEPGALEALLDRERPEAVVLAAAVSRVDEAERDPDAARRLNAEVPGRLGQLAAERGLRALLISTDQVFGAEPPPPGGFWEGTPTGPLSVYGATKAVGEAAFLSAHPGGLVVRLPLLFGDSRGRGLGASDALLAAVARGERPFLFEDEWRTPLEARDGAELLLELLGGAAAGVVHLAGPERLTRAAFGERLFQRPPWPFERGKRSARNAQSRPRDTSLASVRVRALLSRAPLSLDAALDRARTPSP